MRLNPKFPSGRKQQLFNIITVRGFVYVTWDAKPKILCVLLYSIMCVLSDYTVFFVIVLLKGTILEKKCSWHGFLYIVYGTILLQRSIQWGITIEVRSYSCEVPYSFVRFCQNLRFIDMF